MRTLGARELSAKIVGVGVLAEFGALPVNSVDGVG
jgi:hypothetical protein